MLRIPAWMLLTLACGFTGLGVLVLNERLSTATAQTVVEALETRELRIVDATFIPPILDLEELDGRLLVEAEEAFFWTKQLLDVAGVFAGISSGAVIAAARKVAEKMTFGRIVCLLADGGWKYLSTGLWTRIRRYRV